MPPKMLALALLCCGCTLPQIQGQRTPQPIAEIPIELRHRLPTVDVRVAGQTLQLFLDLGGHRALALTPSELARVVVKFRDPPEQFRNSKGQVLTSRRFIAQRVYLGALALGDVEGGESIFGDSAPPDRNGYVGMPVLGAYLLVVDYPNRRVRFYESGNTDALTAECGAKTFRVDVLNGIAVSIGVSEHGSRRFLWDTGSTDNIIRPSALSADGANVRRIDDGPPVVTIKSLSFSGHEYGAQEFRVIPFGAPDVDGYLGAGFFFKHRVCLDIPKGIGAITEAP